MKALLITACWRYIKRSKLYWYCARTMLLQR